MNEVQTEQIGDFLVKIYPDEDPQSPRELDNLGTMVCFHRNYNLGDQKHGFSDPNTLASHIKEKKSISLPIYMMDHSGQTISTDPTIFQAFDAQRWDWGQIGFIFVDPEKVKKEFKVKKITEKIRGKVISVLNQEIETYDQYMQGDVYGFVIEDENGNDINSCWGFYGLEDCLEQAKENANHIAKNLSKSGAGI